MTLGPSAFLPNDEVDEIRWLGVAEAAVQLTYSRDRAVLERFAACADAG
jgi:hypothetical protein